MNKTATAEKVLSLLEKNYPQAGIVLEFSSAWQLLVSVILSAQCTDSRVNKVTGELFAQYPDIEDYAQMDPARLMEIIRPCGFYRNKAKNIIGSAKMILDEHGGKLPDSMQEMIKLPGVARKTANVVLGNAYGVVEGIAVDTHVKRVSFRLGLTGSGDPVKTEKDLMALFPRGKWFLSTYLFIEHGRKICRAPVPSCSACRLAALCPRRGVKKSK